MFYLLIAFRQDSLIALIDFLVPESGNPHEIHGVEKMNKRDALHRAGLSGCLFLWHFTIFRKGIMRLLPHWKA